MNIIKIDVPKGIEYISDIKEIKEDYKGDLPANALICKQLTGTGGTSLALTNDEPYIVAVHLVSLIKNKIEQVERYPNVLGVYQGVTTEQIRDYVAKGGKKIMVTYDSVPKVKEALGEKAKDFRLLIDEFHKMIIYLGSFKPNVCIKLLNNNQEFKSVSYLTATPTDYKYLPEPMRSLDIIEMDWEGKVTPHIEHAYVKEGMVERLLATVLDKYNNTSEEMYIFYNSKAGVISFLKKLFKCKKTLSLKDVNFMFAENPNNTRYFKKHLGSNFSYGSAPNGSNNKRINVISSMGFEGHDYYPNHITNAIPVSIIVTTPDQKSSRFSIETDVKQILGRFRKNQITNQRVDNPIIYLWSTQSSDYNLNEEDFLAKATQERTDLIQFLEDNKDSLVAQRMAKAALVTKEFDDLISDDEGNPMLHPYGIEAKMSTYKAMHSDSAVLGNIDQDGEILEDATITKRLLDLDPNMSTYNLPLLPSEYTKALGRQPSVRKQIEEYSLLLKEYEENYKDEDLRQTIQDTIDNFYIINPLFKEWLDSGVTLAMMRASKMNRSLITDRATQTRTIISNTDEVKAQLNLQVGKIYTRDELLVKVLDVYESLDISVEKPKATDIKRWYEIKNSPKKLKGETISAYKIIKEL
ncbi:hypothetical protein [Pseudomonas sp.]|uniref:hypothetical protein n=1 Tax=Pseudomonas sp. TaxID=306 RepID=UPI0026031B99|nr:hypothetical protein [Pseudomonas sp.]